MRGPPPELPSRFCRLVYPIPIRLYRYAGLAGGYLDIARVDVYRGGWSSPSAPGLMPSEGLDCGVWALYAGESVSFESVIENLKFTPIRVIDLLGREVGAGLWRIEVTCYFILGG